MESKEKEKWIKSGEIASQIMKKALLFAKPEAALLEIAQKIEAEAEKQKVQFAFPINLSINEAAAHYSPAYDDKTVASGLLKIDLGISVDGYISDMAKSVDLTPEQKHKEMIKANEEALKEAVKTAKCNVEIREIGKSIHSTLVSKGFAPIRNLSGHELMRHKLHAGITIPNYDNNNTTKLPEGVYAIEPFATNGEGLVMDGKPSGIYRLEQSKPVRDSKAREMLGFIEKEYKTLPFSSRWLITKFGLRAMLSLRFLEQQGVLHHFSQLIEKSRHDVSQAEHTVLVEKDKVVVTTAD